MSAQHRYVGLDVHKDTVVIAVAEAGRTGEVRSYGTISFDLHAVERAVAKLRADGKHSRGQGSMGSIAGVRLYISPSRVICTT